MKKILSLLCVLSMLLGVLCVGGVDVSSAATDGDFEYKVWNGEATITDYTGSATELTIPSTLGGYPVTRISASAFYGCASLTSIVLPDGVTSIDWNAFYGCASLKSIAIPDSVTFIFDSAFRDCDSLADVYYTGSKAEWNAIRIYDYNDDLLNATIHYNYVSEEPDIPDEPDEPDVPTLGDLSGDGAIDMRDAFALYSATSGSSNLTAAQKAAADMNGDGAIDMRDAFALYKIASGG